MNDLPDMCERKYIQGRRGGLYWLLILAVGLIILAVSPSFMEREDSDLFVFGLLTLFSVIGVLALFASAAGILCIGEREWSSLLARKILEALDEGVVVTVSDQSVIYANAAYREMSGTDSYSVPSMVMRTFAANPEANEPMYRLAQAAREGRQWEEQFRIFSGSNEPRAFWYRVSVQPMKPLLPKEPVGKVQILWRVANITSEREDQENVFLELQHAIDYLDHAPVGFFSASSDEVIHYMNATLAGWLGFDLVQTVSGNLTLKDIVAGDTAALLVRAMPTPGEVCVEPLDLDLRRRDGTSLPVRLLHGVSFTADGGHGYSRTIVINRSQGEDISEDLRAAEVRFARFFHNAPIAIATIDSNGCIAHANSVFAQMQAKCSDRLGSRPLLLQLLDKESHASVSEALRDARLGKSDILPVDAALAGEGGISIRLFVSPVQDDRTDREVALVYAIDTTAQRALEMQFAQSQKMQAVGQLAGGVAHDFNNVLTAIIGYSDLLLAAHRPTDPPFQDIMNIKQSANRAASLVRQLLAFSRRQTLQLEVLYLPDALSELTTMLRRLLNEKVVLEVEHDRALWLIKADRTQLDQVIVNLVVNARDAIKGAGKITLRTMNVKAKDVNEQFYPTMPVADYVKIEVSDTGVGMSEEIISKIFEPFFSTKEVGKGTGLGLSMVYGIVKQTGGFIFPTSEIGKGSTFHIFLPRHIPSSSDDGAKKVEHKVTVGDTTGTGVILLVEDEGSVRTFACRALTSRGYTVLEASTGLEALSILDSYGSGIDLVLSDVVMPEMDGPTLLKELRLRIPDVKVIFMSGYAEDAFHKNLENNARFTFLQKPFNLKELAATVKRVLEEK